MLPLQRHGGQAGRQAASSWFHCESLWILFVIVVLVMFVVARRDRRVEWQQQKQQRQQQHQWYVTDGHESHMCHTFTLARTRLNVLFL